MTTTTDDERDERRLDAHKAAENAIGCIDTGHLAEAYGELGVARDALESVVEVDDE